MKHRFQIIIVEDAPEDFELVTRALRKAGCECDTRRVDGPDELDEELLRLAPDIVICDHAGTQWDSFAVLERVRCFNSTMPFVVVSGSVSDSMREQLLDSGADGCVSKDALPELAGTVERALLSAEQERRKRVEAIRREGLATPPSRRSRSSRSAA